MTPTILAVLAMITALVAIALELVNIRRVGKALRTLESRTDEAIERNLNTRRKKLHDNGRYLPARPHDGKPARVHKLRIRSRRQ